MTAPGIPNEYVLSTTCFGSRLTQIDDQIFAAVAMGFRRIELGLTETPPGMDGLEDSRRETGISIRSLLVGCRDPIREDAASRRLGSLVNEERERAMNCVRRHVRLAQAWGCPHVVVRGSRIDDSALAAKGRELASRMARNGLGGELRAEIADHHDQVRVGAQRQVESFCRSLHELMQECPDIRFAIEPGSAPDDFLGYDAVGWILDDLSRQELGYWHDTGGAHLRERMGLEPQEQWLEAYAARMSGIHIQDACEEDAAMPLGLGEVDFRSIAGYVPKKAERVLELGPRHGRPEILSSVQYLVDHGF